MATKLKKPSNMFEELLTGTYTNSSGTALTEANLNAMVNNLRNQYVDQLQVHMYPPVHFLGNETIGSDILGLKDYLRLLLEKHKT